MSKYFGALPPYPSSDGLGVKHMFGTPVELLATCTEFYWSDDFDWAEAYYVGKGGWYKPSPPSRLVHALAKTNRVDLPRALWHLVGKQASITGFSSTDVFKGTPLTNAELNKVVEKHYWYTSDIRQFYRLNNLVCPKGSNPRPTYIRQMDVETTLKDFSTSEAISDRQKRLYFDRLSHLRAMQSIFDALALALQVVKRYAITIPHRSKRLMSRMKAAIAETPFSVACDLKSLANECRVYYFGGKKPSGKYSGIVAGFSRYECLKFSYIARSLPAPLEKYVNKGTFIDDLAYRLTLPSRAENKAWGPWVRDYIRRFKPKVTPYWTAPSNSAALGIPRHLGGHSRGYQYLIMYEIGARLSEMGMASFERKFVRMPPIGDIDTEPLCTDVYSKARLSLEGMSSRSVRWSECLNNFMIAGCMRQVRRLKHIPVIPLVCPEKGMKVRMPTCTLTSVNLLEQPLRKVADSVLRSDDRISSSLGGRKPYPAFKPLDHTEEFVSVDAKYATDGHEFWLTRTFYDELVDQVPQLEWSKEFLPKLFGPRRLLLSNHMTRQEKEAISHPVPMQVRKVPKPGVMTTDSGKPKKLYSFISKVTDHPDWEAQCFEYVNEGITFEEVIAQLCDSRFERRRLNTPDPDDIWEGLMKFHSAVNQYLDDLDSLPSVITTKGAMMGDPTSWPVLPLVTLFSTRKLKHRRTVRTCGDDVLLVCNKEEFTQFTREYEESCGQLSIEKTFKHKRKGLFVEIPFVNGKERKIDLLSSWVGPSGGSKGELNWYNLPFSVRPNEMASGGFWKKTRFRACWRAAQEAGIPVGADSFFGGLGVPGFPKNAGHQTAQWLRYMSQISLYQLLMRGGLSLVPPAGARSGKGDKLLWKVIEPFIERLPSQHEIEPYPWLTAWEGSNMEKIDEPYIYESQPISEVLPRMRNARSVMEIYFGGYQVPRKIPGVVNTSEMFTRRIRQCPPSRKVWDYDRTLSDVKGKKVRWLALPPPAESKYRVFGISSRYATAFQEFFPWEQPFKHDDPDPDDLMYPSEQPAQYPLS